MGGNVGVARAGAVPIPAWGGNALARSLRFGLSHQTGAVGYSGAPALLG